MAIIVPYTDLSESALIGIIKAFVLGEGTDYGEQEYDISEKINQVMKQLQSGKAFIAYEDKDQSVTIITKEQAKSLILE